LYVLKSLVILPGDKAVNEHIGYPKRGDLFRPPYGSLGHKRFKDNFCVKFKLTSNIKCPINYF
jgi:hypothetical protein